MTGSYRDMSRRGTVPLRILGWGGAASLLLLPFIAMRFGDDVNWSAEDFFTMGAMLAVAGGAIELAARMSGSWTYRAGAGAAVLASFLLVWVNLAVGFLGSEDNVANLMFAGVIMVAIAGSSIAGFKAAGMAKAMAAAAVAQLAAGAIGVAAGWASPGTEGLYEVAIGSTLYCGLWLLSAWLFQRAALK